MKKFVKERNEAVWSFDVHKFKKYINKYFPEKYSELTKHDETFIKGTMAKMAMNITTTPPDVMIEALKILKSLGWDAEI